MYALAINGSPRKKGNTQAMLQTTLEPLEKGGWETETLQVGGKNIKGCLACMKCWKEKNLRCAMDKDGFNDIFAKMLEADAIIIGSPTYFADVSAETKALIDRSGFVGLANDYALAGKVGVPVAAQRRCGAVPVLDTINHMFLMSRMIVPGSTYWNLGFGTMPGDVVEESPSEMANLRNLGHMIDWLGKAIHSNMDSFPAAETLASEGG